MKLICNDSDLAEGQAKRFLVNGEDLILVRFNGELKAYRNLCPHMNLPLTTRLKAVVNKEQAELICLHHAAAFAIKNGDCVKGPCQGEHLKVVSVSLHDEQVFIT